MQELESNMPVSWGKSTHTVRLRPAAPHAERSQTLVRVQPSRPDPDRSPMSTIYSRRAYILENGLPEVQMKGNVTCCGM